jgi:hypothetical protein
VRAIKNLEERTTSIGSNTTCFELESMHPTVWTHVSFCEGYIKDVFHFSFFWNFRLGKDARPQGLTETYRDK